VMHIANTLAAIRSEVTRHLGESALPEMSALTKVFSLVALAGQSEAPAATEADATQETAAEQPPAAVQSASAPLNWRSAQIQSRDDAQLMLDKVKNY
ncbi:type VI secretion system protein TssA, partial [Salmonella enterica subsp. enterica serovar 1,4,[5],12:i:-]|nr:type VI secretion system protein TssA [Salmonella enterica subsp. enterica serovar 1,4,[5],12:i:-]